MRPSPPIRPRQPSKHSSTAPTVRTAAWPALALLVLSGCTTRWAVDSWESPATTSPAERQTFYWQGGALQTAEAVDLATLQASRGEIEASVVRALAAKGYRQVASEGDAAMIVSYEAALGPATFTTDTPSATRRPGDVATPFASEWPQKRMTTSSRVVVVIDDPATRRALWRGVVDDEVRVASTQHALELVVAMTADIATRVPECHKAPLSVAARL